MDVEKLFAQNVFNDEVMRLRIPQDAYSELKRCIAEDRSLPLWVANEVATAMKDWAIERGATHYTHWFQPMTGITAEKHDAFLTLKGEGVVSEFGGKELIKGEPDASSFPSGGLRATFEARGYTAWDPTAYAFIKGGVLCIPTAFCSYNGQALDKKTPLLRSMQALNKQALRLLRALGNEEVSRVYATVGPEQEYFLVDTDVFLRRPDLVYTGRTLLGARPPKGQDLDDHYFGAIKPRVAAFMDELDEELWKLGVPAKTKHNETAPAQHELAPIYGTTNVATDHNQLTMETLKVVAKRHGMTCLLAEKPFEGVNGSGKHNNWALSTDTGVNLLEPGNDPRDNLQFLLFLTAVIKAVDEYQDLLRISVASAGNDHRLGAAEAPPATISMFLGDELTGVLTAIREGRAYSKRAQCDVEIGVKVLPRFPVDSTDRNRTSPFAFTGNKFEFRMPGASFSIADINTVLNTIVAEELRVFADELEGAADVKEGATALIRKTLVSHSRIIFNGNNYGEEWRKEAAERGLLSLAATPDALPYLTSPKNVELFGRHGVYSEAELNSRREIMYDNYNKVLHIETLTMVDMVTKDVLPAVLSYVGELAKVAKDLRAVGVQPDLTRLNETYSLYQEGQTRLQRLLEAMAKAQVHEGEKQARVYADEVIPAMKALRATADTLELNTPTSYWPYPTIGDILFSVS